MTMPREIVTEKLADIEQIENRRPDQKDTDAVYFLSPKPHIIDCIMADFERRKYRGAFIIWTSCKVSVRYGRRAAIDTYL
jgi:syntaxin-binding protein 1